ncbi:hypothetical protein CROQUDRAFT_42576, partial [Cronartium quercuum f. sp. fusiforme G11]
MDLEHAGFKWSKDSVLGMWYQLGLPSSYANISMVLNARLRAHPNRPVSAREVEEAIRAKNQEHGTPGSGTLVSFNAIDLNATQGLNGNQPPFVQGPTPQIRGNYRQPMQNSMNPMTYPHTLSRQNAGIHQPTPMSSIGAAGQRRMTLRMSDLDHCLCCSQMGHWVRACPYNQPILSNFGNQQLRLNLVDMNGSEFTAEVLPNSNTTTEMDTLPEGVWASESNLTEAWDNPDEGVSDSGATHNITGDMSRLTNVRALPRPIPVSVATKGPETYVTHRGTMHLRVDDGSPIPIHNTYYAPAAQCTLISLLDLVESGGSW